MALFAKFRHFFGFQMVSKDIEYFLDTFCKSVTAFSRILKASETLSTFEENGEKYFSRFDKRTGPILFPH